MVWVFRSIAGRRRTRGAAPGDNVCYFCTNWGSGWSPKRRITIPNPRPKEAQAQNVLCRAREQVSPWVSFLSVRNRTECHQKNQQVQLALQFLLQLQATRGHPPSRRGHVGNRRHQILWKGPRPAAIHLQAAHRHFLCVFRAIYGNWAVSASCQEI